MSVHSVPFNFIYVALNTPTFNVQLTVLNKELRNDVISPMMRDLHCKTARLQYIQ